jgi:hypothetical protein
VACNDVPRHLRDTLKIPLDTFIAVTVADETKVPLDSMGPVITALKAAGYTLVIGSIEIGSDATPVR